MKQKLKNGIALALFPQLFFVGWLSGRPDIVEKYYSTVIYPYVSQFFRMLFGWVPFSIGELVYTLLVCAGLRYVIKNRTRIGKHPWLFLRNIALVISVFYFTFNLVWGINYYRKPLAEQLAIRDSITLLQVIDLTEELILESNRLQLEITGDTTRMVKVPYNQAAIFDKTIAAYYSLQKHFPYLGYRSPSLKKVTLGAMASYMGIGGYLNPFTNEAQVNGLTPVFRLPVVTAHEIGHQVGYAKENETNFIGYFVTLKNGDIYFRYSAVAYALSHCLITVRRADEPLFDALYEKVNGGVQENYKELYELNLRYVNPFEPIFKTIFNTFLKANQQKDGIKSYSKIVELMVGYHEKHPL